MTAALQTPALTTSAAPAALPTELVANEQPAPVRVAPPAPKKCSLCFSDEKHEIVEGAKCSVCAHAHGDTVHRAGRDRKVVVRHSLPVEREGGRTGDDRWTNPGAQWVAPAICDDCAWDARRAARKADVRSPRYFDLAGNVAECAARDARDVQFRAARKAERAKLEAERAAEKERQERIALMVAKGARVLPPSGKRERGNRRDPRNGERGDRGRTSGRPGRQPHTGRDAIAYVGDYGVDDETAAFSEEVLRIQRDRGCTTLEAIAIANVADAGQDAGYVRVHQPRAIA